MYKYNGNFWWYRSTCADRQRYKHVGGRDSTCMSVAETVLACRGPRQYLHVGLGGRDSTSRDIAPRFPKHNSSSSETAPRRAARELLSMLTHFPLLVLCQLVGHVRCSSDHIICHILLEGPLCCLTNASPHSCLTTLMPYHSHASPHSCLATLMPHHTHASLNSCLLNLLIRCSL